MHIMDHLGARALFIDGGLGTQLQKAGMPSGTAPDLLSLRHPEAVREVHQAYLAAGARVITTNTFGTNALKLEGTGYTVAEVARAAVSLARQAGDTPHFVALDIGPTGRLLSPLGDLPFDRALSLFRETVEAGAEAGADLVLIETMTDAYELRAAVLAAKECGLPVFATVAVDARGKLLTGADLETVATLLTGLRVDALGLNCGLGAEALLPHLMALREFTDLPLILQPNAGLPRQENGHTVYDETPEQFAEAMERALEQGAAILGGCCGTTPAHIRALTERLSGKAPPKPVLVQRTAVCSGSRTVRIGGEAPVLIGERINPTGKPAMKRALKEGRADYMLREALRQQEAGAHVLDVNAGMPGIDEGAWLARLTREIQAVCDAPLQLDTANPQALEGALRLYNGKPMINSVNGKEESLQAVLPLAAKYGGVVVALTLDDQGIPKTAEGRLAVARRIVERAEAYGIPRQDILVDPLTMAVSAEPGAALTVLEALSLIRRELRVGTVLGVSNISFGLPQRAAMNAAFVTLCLGAGLSAAIINPFSGEMMRAYHAARALLGSDPGCALYVAALSEEETETAQKPAPRPSVSLGEAVRRGLKAEAGEIAGALLLSQPPLRIVEEHLIPALGRVGDDFAAGRAFLPQLLMSAEAARAAFDALGQALSGARGGRGTVVIATVQGDIHDIGKNIAKAMLENYQFDIIDLGRDVPPERVVEAARESGARLVGLSALMTTTVRSMEKTIRLLRRELPAVKVMVGGAVLTEGYAREIGADAYVGDAMASVHFAQEVYGAQ